MSQVEVGHCALVDSHQSIFHVPARRQGLPTIDESVQLPTDESAHLPTDESV